MKINIFHYALLMAGLSYCLSAEEAKGISYEPIMLKSSKGALVEVVAIHSISSKGLTFSPKPNAPLIGSNKLQTFTTGWENIDTSILDANPILAEAYQAAQKGKNTELKFGPHFHEISESMKIIRFELPRVSFLQGDDPRVKSLELEILVKNHRKYKPHKWSMSAGQRSDLLKKWEAEHNALEAINYRSDIIRFRTTLNRAIKGVEKIPSALETLDKSAAQDIAELMAEI